MFVELNHALEDGMKAFPWLMDVRVGAIFDHAASRPRYQNKAEFYLGKIEMPLNIGTYMDTPFHRYPDGADLSEISLDRVAGLPGVVVDGAVGAGRAVRFDAAPAELSGKAVLVRTGWDQRWGTERYWEPGPYLSSESLELLLAGKPALVGVDFWNVDNTEDLSRPAHSRLLAAGILIVESMTNLGALPRSGFRFYAAPLRVVGGAAFPVRAFAELP